MNGTKDMIMQAGYQVRSKIDAGWPRDRSLSWAQGICLGIEGNTEAGRHRSVLFPRVGLAWAEQAFSTVDVSHKLAASLMMTSVPDEYIDSIMPPWRSFCVNLPGGLVGSEQFALCVNIDPPQVAECPWILLMVSDEGMTRVNGNSFSELFMPAVGKNRLSDDANNISDSYLDDVELRHRLISRLIIGVCIEMMSSPWESRKHLAGAAIKQKRGLPRPYTYQLKRDVKLDVRSAIADLLSGDHGRLTSVQSLVRGHNKMQAHGPLHSLRKWIHVEPYWRGPEDAPIAVRSHQLGGQ